MKVVNFPYRWMPSTVGKNLSHAWWDIRQGLKAWRIFAGAVWRFRSWDYTGLLEVMEVATREMRDTHRYHGHLVSNPRIARQLTVVTELCRRLREGRYDENAGYLSGPEWWNLSKGQRNAIFKHGAYMAKQDAEYLGKMFRFVQHWWD